jgi:GT2 family glycosyltransferase
MIRSGRSGIGITTYNRPDICQYTLEQIRRYPDGVDRVIVVSDGTPLDQAALPDMDGLHVEIIQHAERRGVAAAKNSCLYALQDCDYLVLLDDDTFPYRADWMHRMIRASDLSGVQHFQYFPEQIEADYLAKYPEYAAIWRKDYDGIPVVSRRMIAGPMLFLTRRVLQTIGGFAPYPGKWGFEHAGWSQRISRAGFCAPFRPYAYVGDIGDYIWSIDWLGVPEAFPYPWRSSLSDDEKFACISQNERVYQAECHGQVYQPFEPFEPCKEVS